MLRSAACFVILLLMIGSVSALTVNPSAVKVQKILTTVPTTPQTMAPGMARTVQAPVALVQQETFVTVHIQSDPSGADVTVDGADTPLGKTPITIALQPGSHTFLVTHAGYRQNTTTMNLKTGMPGQYFTITLERLVVQGISHAVVSLTGVPRTMVSLAGTPRTPVSIPHPVTLSTPAPQSCPSSDWTCMPLAQAAAQFGYPYAQYGSSPCGYVQDGSQTVPEYCCMAVPGGSPFIGSFATPGILKTDPGLHIVNRTRRVNATNMSVQEKPLGALVRPQQDVVSSVLGFFTGLFAKPVQCPEGKTNCGGGCTDTRFDEMNCGFCGMTCFDPAVCCNGECVDLLTDEMDCGFCGMTCFDPAVCCYGSCEDSCDYVVGVEVTQQPVVGVEVTQQPVVGVEVTP